MTSAVFSEEASTRQQKFATWALGEINSNIKRALLAEYIVANALTVDSLYHNQWEDFDLMVAGVSIEVKSSGIITPPFPTPYRNRNPRFDIAARSQFWSHEENRRINYSSPTRPAKCYIFCLHTPEEESCFRPFDFDQWEFCICITEIINAIFSSQKSASWNRLLTVGQHSKFSDLKDSFANVLGVEL
jgi:hypothetical protein